ncbi:iron chelate uptake ABC transporter family permease subunit [Cytobacillus firmus]|nr:iron chelate uptake ABC transporter family permease subunit [Cytobacillus firmus]
MYPKGWGDVQFAVIISILFLPLAVLMYRSLDMLSFVGDTAAGLGLQVGKTRVLALLVGSFYPQLSFPLWGRSDSVV